MKYKFFDHTADVLFEAYGSSKEEMFVNAAEALTSLQIELGSIDAVTEKTFTVEAESTEMLLFEFLQELIFLKDAEHIIFNEFSVNIEGEKLTATCKGEETDVDKHEMKVDAKAITMHEFEVKEEEDGKWKCRVIVDI